MSVDEQQNIARISKLKFLIKGNRKINKIELDEEEKSFFFISFSFFPITRMSTDPDDVKHKTEDRILFSILTLCLLLLCVSFSVFTFNSISISIDVSSSENVEDERTNERRKIKWIFSKFFFLLKTFEFSSFLRKSQHHQQQHRFDCLYYL